MEPQEGTKTSGSKSKGERSNNDSKETEEAKVCEEIIECVSDNEQWKLWTKKKNKKKIMKIVREKKKMKEKKRKSRKRAVLLGAIFQENNRPVTMTLCWTLKTTLRSFEQRRKRRKMIRIAE